MTVMSVDQIETVDDLITEMAKAITPAAFSERGSEKEQGFCRLAAMRVLKVVAPIIIREAVAMAGDNEKIASDIKRLNEIF
jgi:hypothetical protein